MCLAFQRRFLAKHSVCWKTFMKASRFPSSKDLKGGWAFKPFNEIDLAQKAFFLMPEAHALPDWLLAL